MIVETTGKGRLLRQNAEVVDCCQPLGTRSASGGDDTEQQAALRDLTQHPAGPPSLMACSLPRHLVSLSILSREDTVGEEVGDEGVGGVVG